MSSTQSTIRPLKDFVERLLIAILVSILTPFIVGAHLWISRKWTGFDIANRDIVLFSLIALAITVAFIAFFRSRVFDPVKKALPADKKGLARISGAVIIFLYMMTVAGSTQVYIAQSVKRQLEKPRRMTEKLIDKISDDHLLKDGRAMDLVADAVMAINNSVGARADVIDSCHSLSSYSVDIGWCGHNSILELSLDGELLNSERPGSDCAGCLRIVHWADVPVGMIRKYVKAYDLHEGHELRIDFEQKRPDQTGGVVPMYYLGTISEIPSDFSIKEVVKWPCALWRDPDAVIVDCQKFRGGIDLLTVNIFTDNGATYIPVYRLTVDENLYVDGIEFDTFLDPVDEVPVNRSGEDYWSQQGMKWHSQLVVRKPKDIYVFIIYRRDEPRVQAGGVHVESRGEA